MKYVFYFALSLLIFSCVGDHSQSQTTDTVGNESDVVASTVTDTVEHRIDSGENLLETAISKRAHIPVKVNDLIGINAFEWDFLQNPNDHNEIEKIYEPHIPLIKSFKSVRHFLDWENMELAEGSYTFNPAARGSWNYDLVYEWAKSQGIDMLICIKNSPAWLYQTYPQDQHDNENAPAPYGANREDPKSYIAMGRFAFQFAARYGRSKNIDSSLVSVNSTPRWNHDPINRVKIGLNLVKYVECNNEPDKWWKGPKAEQNGRAYAANLSAFYDGHQGRLGKNVGIKNADPNMKVVMGGLARADIQFVKDMVEWCRENRGLKADGSVDLCFDILNFHMYSNDNMTWYTEETKNTQRGRAPETTSMAKIADTWTEYAASIGNMPVWMTESGYDLGPKSVQRAIPIGDKPAIMTQADWVLRTSLLLARHGVQKVFFFQLFDTDAPGANSNSPFGRSGLVDYQQRRPAANYLYQFGRLMGNYEYQETLSRNPMVDRYELDGKSIYVLYVPDEQGRTAGYELDLKGAEKAVIRYLNPKGNQMTEKPISTQAGKINVQVTETPIFVEATS